MGDPVTKYIASLSDPNLSESIEWGADSLAEVRRFLEGRGLWQDSPDGGGKILLSEAATVFMYENPHVPLLPTDDLRRLVVDHYPTHIINIGPSGGVRSEKL